MATLGVPTFFSRSPAGLPVSTRPRQERISKTEAGVPRPPTARARPSRPRAFWALAASSRPAPTTPSSGVRSSTATSKPARRNAIAADSPPMPAPATITLAGSLMFLPFPPGSGDGRSRGRTSAGRVRCANGLKTVAACRVCVHPQPSRLLRGCRGIGTGSNYFQVDRADAAPDVDVQGNVRIAVGVVHVRLAFPLETFGVDLAEAAFGVHPHPHFAGHQHRCLADASLYAGFEILGVISGQVHRGLPRPHLEVEARQSEAVKVQIALPGAHLDDEIRRHLVVEAQVPLVARAAAEAAIIAAALLHAKVAVLAAHVVIYLRLPVAHVVGELALHERVGRSAHLQLSGAHRQVRAHGLGVLRLDRARLVPHLPDALALTLRPARTQKNRGNHQQHGQPFHPISFVRRDSVRYAPPDDPSRRPFRNASTSLSYWRLRSFGTPCPTPAYTRRVASGIPAAVSRKRLSEKKGSSLPPTMSVGAEIP